MTPRPQQRRSRGLSAILTAFLLCSLAGLAGASSDQQAGTPDDEAARLATLRERALKGDARAQAEIGYEHYKRDTPEERAEGLRWITAAARQGDTYALALLAYHYRYTQEHVDRRLDKVLAFSIRGAQLGDIRAIGSTGMLYYNERPSELHKALELLEEAGSRGHAPSALLLGYHYWDGRRAPRDGERAVKWLRLAAQRGSQVADLLLAHCHATGFGVPRDPAQADRLYAVVDKVDPDALNEFSWHLAVNHHDDVRDGARAVQIMEGVLRQPANVSAERVDTLAAAYAEAGRFAEAVKAQRRALALLTRDPRFAKDAKTLAQHRKDFEHRLALYLEGQPFRSEK